MFGEISIWAWMGMVIVFGIGGGTGFFISRQIKDKRTLELEEKLAAARDELAGYRGDVNQHFLKTSLLLGKLTNNYREVYEHLATGAQKLCNEKPNTPKLDLPETKILPSVEIVETETPAIEMADESTIGEQQETLQNEQAAAENTIETSDEAAEQIQTEAAKNLNDSSDTEEAVVAKSTDNPSTEQVTEQKTEQNSERPAPEDIPDNEENDDDVHLGAESAPSVDTELHKTHPAIH